MNVLLSLLQKSPDYMQLLQAVEAKQAVAVSGLSQAPRSHVLAAAHEQSGRPLIAVCQDDMAAKRLASELGAFLGEEPPVLPSRELTLAGAIGVSRQWEQQRLRLLYALERPVRFIICDGDIVEEKNLVRQNFTPADLGENKAKVLAERYSSVFGMETEYVPEFIESGERLLSMLQARSFPTGPYWHSPTVKELVILIGAVDNNKSRTCGLRLGGGAPADGSTRSKAGGAL